MKAYKKWGKLNKACSSVNSSVPVSISWLMLCYSYINVPMGTSGQKIHRTIVYYFATSCESIIISKQKVKKKKNLECPRKGFNHETLVSGTSGGISVLQNSQETRSKKLSSGPTVTVHIVLTSQPQICWSSRPSVAELAPKSCLTDLVLFDRGFWKGCILVHYIYFFACLSLFYQVSAPIRVSL